MSGNYQAGQRAQNKFFLGDDKHSARYGLRPNMRKWAYILFFTFAALFLLVRVADWAARRGHTLPPLPQPNGYDELVSAARSIKPMPSDFSELTNEQIESLAEKNRPALEQARKAFSMKSRVSLQTKADWQERHEEELKSLKRLAVAFALEAKSHALSNRTNEAARCNLDVIRLAQTTGKGGLLVDGITALAIEMIGAASLQGNLPHYDVAFCQEAARALEEIDFRRETPETVIATEKAWSSKRFGLIDRIGGFVGKNANAERYAKFIERSHDTRIRTQRLMLRLSARAYELENQKLPANVSDLVPAFLKAIPRDLKTGKEIQELPLLTK